MNRCIEFSSDGDTLVTGIPQPYRITYGIVLLTEEQAKEAENHNWIRVESCASERSRGMVRVKKEPRKP